MEEGRGFLQLNVTQPFSPDLLCSRLRKASVPIQPGTGARTSRWPSLTRMPPAQRALFLWNIDSVLFALLSLIVIVLGMALFLSIAWSD